MLTAFTLPFVVLPIHFIVLRYILLNWQIRTVTALANVNGYWVDISACLTFPLLPVWYAWIFLSNVPWSFFSLVSAGAYRAYLVADMIDCSAIFALPMLLVVMLHLLCNLPILNKLLRAPITRSISDLIIKFALLTIIKYLIVLTI